MVKQNNFIHNMSRYKCELYDLGSITIFIIKHQIKIEQMVNTQNRIIRTVTTCKITKAQHKEA